MAQYVALIIGWMLDNKVFMSGNNNKQIKGKMSSNCRYYFLPIVVCISTKSAHKSGEIVTIFVYSFE